MFYFVQKIKKMFLIQPEITKELLLKKYPEEQYMSFYLGVPVTKKLFKSTLRVDHRETCSFYRSDKAGLRYKDFGSGTNFNFIDVVMYLNKCTYHKALQIIANDFRICDIPDVAKSDPRCVYTGEIIDNKEPCDIKVEVKDFSEKELEWWNSFGVTKELLKEGRVYSIKSVFLNNIPSYFSTDKCPIYGYFLGHEDNRELWKIYFPSKIKYRFLLNTSKLQGLHLLPKKGELVIVTKSMKDILTLRGLGFYAISAQSENSYLKKEQVEALQKRFTHVVFWYDPDRAGMKAMSTLRKMYKALFYWIPSNYKSKDISDFHKKHGREKTKLFLDNLDAMIQSGKLDYHYKKHDVWETKHTKLEKNG